MSAFQNIGSGIAYDYGIDDKGKMWVWDKWANKMMYYGEPKQGYSQFIIPLSTSYDAKLNFQGDKSAVANKATTTTNDTTPSNTNTGSFGTGGSSYTPAPKVLDQEQINSLNDQFGLFDNTYDTSVKKASIKRDTSIAEKQAERDKQQKTYGGKKLQTLQDFSGATTDTALNTRNTLENLVSSLSTMGLGGSRALTRQILDAANQSNRKANQTQAQNNQNLDSAWNDYTVGNENDLAKIKDQYGYDVAEAARQRAQDQQNTDYKIADVYGNADKTDQRSNYMHKGNDLNKVISDSVFVNPQYTGKVRQMATPDLADYTQSIAQYNTAPVGADTPATPGALTPVGANGIVPAGAGNLAMKAIALNDKDLGIKKKTEGDIAYGV